MLIIFVLEVTAGALAYTKRSEVSNDFLFYVKLWNLAIVQLKKLK